MRARYEYHAFLDYLLRLGVSIYEGPPLAGCPRRLLWNLRVHPVAVAATVEYLPLDPPQAPWMSRLLGLWLWLSLWIRKSGRSQG